MRCVLGIDPGASGGVAVIHACGVLEAHKMPATEQELCDLIAGVAKGAGAVVAFLERVGAMPKQGVSSTFKFGQHYGMLRGLLVALQIPREFPTPQTWQKALGCLTGGDKNVSKAKAAELWPHIKWTHATADAALIAEYGRRELVRTGRMVAP